MSTIAPTTPPGLAAPPEALDDDPPVRAIMTALDPVEAPRSLRVATALDRLRTLDTGHLLLRCHRRFRSVGEVDLLRHVLEGGARPARLLDEVSDLARPVTCVGLGMRRSEAAELMLAKGLSVLVVVADGEPCGVLDARTLLHSVARAGRGHHGDRARRVEHH